MIEFAKGHLKQRFDSPEFMPAATRFKSLNETIATAKGLGMYTETWKHNRLKILYADIGREERRKSFIEWWVNLKRCEYYFFTLRALCLFDYLVIRFKKF
jgi:hypothetical protein